MCWLREFSELISEPVAFVAIHDLAAKAPDDVLLLLAGPFVQSEFNVAELFLSLVKKPSAPPPFCGVLCFCR